MGYLFSSALSEEDIAAILRTPTVSLLLCSWQDDHLTVSRLSEKAFQVAGSRENFVLRFPSNEEEFARLKKEEDIQLRLRNKVHLQIPDTRLLEIEDFPIFAIHHLIPGQPLTTEIYESLSREAHNSLILDLAAFFHETHSVPLKLACEWLNIQKNEADLAAAQGKPGWFGGEASPAMRAHLAAILDNWERKLFDEVVNRFDALPVEPGYIVFGHGDLHGYNMALGEDALGPKLIGVFDLGCTGILDIHEDFFRLSLISEDLLEKVIEKYQDLASQKRILQRDRIIIYYQAFLFYLMCEMAGENLSHLKRLLNKHLDYHHKNADQASLIF